MTSPSTGAKTKQNKNNNPRLTCSIKTKIVGSDGQNHVLCFHHWKNLVMLIIHISTIKTPRGKEMANEIHLLILLRKGTGLLCYQYQHTLLGKIE